MDKKSLKFLLEECKDGVLQGEEVDSIDLLAIMHDTIKAILEDKGKRRVSK